MKSRKLPNTTHKKKKKNLRWIKDLNIRLESIKRRNIGRPLLDINPSKIFYNPPLKVMKIKTKINKWNLKLLHSKENHKQDKKTTLRMGENICKQSN